MASLKFEDLVPFLSKLTSKEARLASVKEDLSLWSNKEITLDYEDFNDKGLYLIVEQAYSYIKRCKDLSDSIDKLLSTKNTIPAVILARAYMETIGIGCKFIDEISSSTDEKDIKKVDKLVFSYFGGSKGGDFKSVHVMEGIRYFRKIDEAYFIYLKEKYKFNNYSDYKEFSVEKTYGELSEYSHPNSMGTSVVYPSKFDKKKLEIHMSFLELHCNRAVWQGCHLIRKLRNIDDLIKRFQCNFLK